jgi:hypothetical protein
VAAFGVPGQHHPAARAGTVQLPGGAGGVQHRVAGGQPNGRPCQPGRAQLLVVGGGDYLALLQQLAQPPAPCGPEGGSGAEAGGDPTTENREVGGPVPSLPT